MVVGEGRRAAPARAQGSRSRERGGRRAVLLAAVLAAVFLAGAHVVPRVEAGGDGGPSLARLLYAPVCHQLPSRSLELSGRSVALCARCSGLYLGGALGLLLAAWAFVGRRPGPRPVWLAVAVGPTLIDALLPRVGLPALDALPRLLLAVPAGAAAGLLLAIGIYDWFVSAGTLRTRRPVGGGAAVEDGHG